MTVVVLRELGIHPAIAPATFTCDSIVNSMILSGFLHRIIQHADPDEQDQLADVLLSIESNFKDVFTSSLSAIKSKLKKLKFLTVLDALSRKTTN